MILSARCKKNSTRPQVPTREAVERMAFTEACLRETLRRYTVVPVVTREAMADTEIDGVAIPRGTKIGLHLQGTHDLWAAPQEYRPARFLPGGELEQFPEDVRRCGPRRVCSLTRLLRSLSWTRLVAKTGRRAPVRPWPCLAPPAAAQLRARKDELGGGAGCFDNIHRVPNISGSAARGKRPPTDTNPLGCCDSV